MGKGSRELEVRSARHNLPPTDKAGRRAAAKGGGPPPTRIPDAPRCVVDKAGAASRNTPATQTESHKSSVRSAVSRTVQTVKTRQKMTTAF